MTVQVLPDVAHHLLVPHWEEAAAAAAMGPRKRELREPIQTRDLCRDRARSGLTAHCGPHLEKFRTSSAAHPLATSARPTCCLTSRAYSSRLLRHASYGRLPPARLAGEPRLGSSKKVCRARHTSRMLMVGSQVPPRP